MIIIISFKLITHRFFIFQESLQLNQFIFMVVAGPIHSLFKYNILGHNKKTLIFRYLLV